MALFDSGGEFDGAFKKKAPVRPRRRPAPATEDEPEDSMPVTATAKKSGWGDTVDENGEEKEAPVPPRRRRSVTDEEDGGIATKTSVIPDIDDDEDDGIANLIPDLEDEQEDMARQVAEAPHLTKSRVQSIAELDAAIDMALPSTSEIGVDLSVLQAYLTPQEQVQEPDVPWDFAHELQALASEMQIEADAREEGAVPAKLERRAAKIERNRSE
mmetsp:Transcript_19718/g.33594  ORF Transcript_19718/g.33594 Transcript_19718/m.33594 type:complete len:214 (-) Transcript_19718:18-659(-)